jgi:hypothetical protein
LIVFLGVYPKPVLDRMQPAVDRLVEHVETHSCASDGGACFETPAVASQDDADEDGG